MTNAPQTQCEAWDRLGASSLEEAPGSRTQSQPRLDAVPPVPPFLQGNTLIITASRGMRASATSTRHTLFSDTSPKTVTDLRSTASSPMVGPSRATLPTSRSGRSHPAAATIVTGMGSGTSTERLVSSRHTPQSMFNRRQFDSSVKQRCTIGSRGSSTSLPLLRIYPPPRNDGMPIVYTQLGRETPPSERMGGGINPPTCDVSHLRRSVRGREIRLKQLRSLESVDDLVQRVFRTLKRKRENRRTLAIFVSDNGFMWGEHRLSEKLHPYTQSIEIPFAIRWPGRVRRGIRTPKPVANIDVAPTILDAAGINPQHVVDGRSLLKSWRRRRLLLEHWKQGTSVPSWKSLRTRRLQYIEYFDSEGRRTFREYYNLRRDPWQLRNLLRDGKKRSGPSRSRLLRLHVHLKRAADCSGAGCP